jgi:hypothetical protein
MNFIHTILSKPFFAGATGIGASLLTYLGIITPVLGFAAAFLAVIAGIYSVIHKRNQVLRDEADKKHKIKISNRVP